RSFKVRSETPARPVLLVSAPAGVDRRSPPVDHANHTLLQAGSQTAISDRMRELLARAAQDHVYEQRTQGAVLDEIRQRLEGMEWLLREVRERELGGLSGTLETVSGRLEHLTGKPPAW